MKLTSMLALAMFFVASAALAQSPGTGAGSTAGGSSAAGGQAASSTTTGSSLNGSTTGNNGPSEGLSPGNSTNLGTPPSNAVGSSAVIPGRDGEGGTSGMAAPSGAVRR
jgi:hypothetical protein